LVAVRQIQPVFMQYRDNRDFMQYSPHEDSALIGNLRTLRAWVTCSSTQQVGAGSPPPRISYQVSRDNCLLKGGSVQEMTRGNV